MTYEDYNHEEIENICEEIFDLHSNKLRDDEMLYVRHLQNKNRNDKITHKNRDILVAMYDRLKQI